VGKVRAHIGEEGFGAEERSVEPQRETTLGSSGTTNSRTETQEQVSSIGEGVVDGQVVRVLSIDGGVFGG
jgi:hypothetical protein